MKVQELLAGCSIVMQVCLRSAQTVAGTGNELQYVSSSFRWCTIHEGVHGVLEK